MTGPRLVVDASAVAAWLLPDEATPPGLAAAADGPLAAPQLFWAELRNILLVAERRGRLSAEETARFLTELDGLAVDLDADPSEAETLRLARAHRLTVYDALYLELAKRTGRSLATLDGALKAAAEAEGVALTEG